MDNILKELDFIFKTISQIPVVGDAVDSMAVARAKLRQVAITLKQMGEKPEATQLSEEAD